MPLFRISDAQNLTENRRKFGLNEEEMKEEFHLIVR